MIDITKCGMCNAYVKPHEIVGAHRMDDMTHEIVCVVCFDDNSGEYCAKCGEVVFDGDENYLRDPIDSIVICAVCAEENNLLQCETCNCIYERYQVQIDKGVWEYPDAELCQECYEDCDDGYEAEANSAYLKDISRGCER